MFSVQLLGVPAPKDMGEAQVTFETIFDNIDKDQSGVIEEPEFVEMGREVDASHCAFCVRMLPWL